MTFRPLRFCMVTTFYPPHHFGGDAMFVYRLSNELARLGHSVDVIYSQDAYRVLAGSEAVQEIENHPNITTHGLRNKIGLVSLLATQQTGMPLLELNRLRTLLSREYDVIHYHNISLIGGPWVLGVGRGTKLYTMHEYWLVCPTHVLFKFNREACSHRQCFRCTLSYKRPPQWWRYSDILPEALKHIDTFIAPSIFTKDKHHELGLDIPTVHLPYFVPEPSHTVQESYNPASKSQYFLFVGRLEKLKGLQTLIPIFRDYPKARLLVAGTGNYETKLKHLAAGNENIKFLGHTSGEALQTLYQEAVAVIVPSITYEVFGQVMIEAFIQKTPVIARNLGGMPEVVQASSAGYVYDTNDQLLAAMDKLLADPALRRDLGERGYAAYQREWTAEVHLERYFQLIKQVAS